MPKPLPKLQRVAAYALVLRDDRILLTRLASRISADEKWHLPGGGVDHGENPRDALVREIREETGLDAEVGDTARVYSAHLPSHVAQGPALGLPGPPHRVRRVGAPPTPRSRGSSRSTARPSTWAGTRSPTCSDRSAARHRASSPRRWPSTDRSGSSGSGSTRWSGAATPSCSPGSRRSGRIRARGRCPAAGSTTARRRATPWPARWPRRPGWRRSSATCSTSTTSTSTARRRRVATRTSTGSTWSSGYRCPTSSSRRSSRPAAPPTPWRSVPLADLEAGRLEVLDVVRAALAADT